MRCLKDAIAETQDHIDVLDEYGIRTGEILPRKEIHALGKIHRAVHLYLFDRSNHLLLQRRSLTTDHYPGMLSISLTGHVDAGESSSAALFREIQEELHLNPLQMRIHFLFSFRQDVTVSPSYIDRQFNDVYACWHQFDTEKIEFNPEEISELQLVPFTKFKEMVFKKDSPLAPVYATECNQLIYLLDRIK